MSRKYVKKFICIFCMAVVMFVLTPFTSYAASGNLPSDFEVEYTLESADFTHRIRLWRGQIQTGLNMDVLPVTVNSSVVNSDSYFLTIPKEAAKNSFVIYFPQEFDISIDGEKLVSGAAVDALSEGEHTVVCNGMENKIYCYYLSDIPTVYLDLEPNGEFNISKDAKTAGDMVVINNGIKEYSGPLEYIKGRGNTTWFTVKKPYNIKLMKKANILGMGEGKSFSLLADYYDDSQLKNAICYNLAQQAGMKYTSDTQHVNLFVNKEYYGRYTFAEKLETGTNRIEIFDLDSVNKAMNPQYKTEEIKIVSANPDKDAYTRGNYLWADVTNEPSNIDGGFLLELEFGARFTGEYCGFVSDYGQSVVIKSPEYPTKKQVEYIRQYYQEMEDALLSDDGYNALGNHYSSYMDEESFSKMYVFNEFTKNLDGGLSSSYLYKDIGGKLCAGPIWDMDSSLGKGGIVNGKDVSDPEQMWMVDGKDYTNKDVYSVFALCCKHADFRNLAVKQWNDSFKPYIENMAGEINKMVLRLENDVAIDLLHYKADTGKTIDDKKATYMKNVEDILNFISRRKAYLSEHFDNDACFVQYCSNGGKGVMIDTNSYVIGDTLYVAECLFYNDEAQFLGWNTKPDGSGSWYQPGDQAEIDGELHLFAQWEGSDGLEYHQRPQAKITLIYRIVNFIETLFNRNIQN